MHMYMYTYMYGVRAFVHVRVLEIKSILRRVNINSLA